MRPVDPQIAWTPHTVELNREEFAKRLHEALTVYVTAMDYPRGTEFHRAPMWTEHSTRPGWKAVGALAGPESGSPAVESLVGIAYGYHGSSDQWWHQQVLHGLHRSGRPQSEISAILDDYFELTELHVHPNGQGHRLGESLIRHLLHDRSERSVLLSTPEVFDEDNRAWRLYRRLGFQDVLRRFRFSGDSRPFAVLGRGLPL
ncbi:GNAT family N-acetyltransferase [Rhodococcus sp. OK302]|uniref:GNAT family N-acetyltransferase n=1 Tax=Rhodococcus sp. OK302 TaxID=1882769 RepID=UPI000B93D7F0|nr:N-acetyltransferase [Rhodococcus sp. OK302]OYD70846.1 acetyltransferase (GNAT) family protein [Rhodococcus sp. OK302]